MKVVVLGATGKTGRYLVHDLLEAGHEVTALVRDEGKLSSSAHLAVRVGDARNVDDLTAVLTGQDAVVSTLGSNKPGDNLIFASTKALIEAMQKTGVKRVVMMSSFLASPQFKPKEKIITRAVQWLSQPLVRDKLSGEDLLRKSDLDWTIVYATRLDGAKPGTYRALGKHEKASLNNAIARADVAKFLAEQLDDKKSVQKSLTVTAG